MSDEPQKLGMAAVLDELRAKLGREPDTAERNVASVLGVERALDLERVRAADRDGQWARAVPSRFRWAAMSNLDRETAGVLADWACTGGENLLITGSTGPGKTYAAIAACRACFDRGLDVIFAPTSTLLASLRPGGLAGVAAWTMEDYLLVDRLIVDDLGSENLTEWGSEQVYLIVDQRWLEERPTVATTNLDAARLEERYGSRLVSRLADGVSLTMVGVDRRRA